MIVLTTFADTEDQFSYLQELDGREYVLRCQWLPRAAAWYLDILESNDGEPGDLITRVKLVAEQPLLRGATDPRLPSGDLIASDVSGQFREIEKREDLGRRVKLLYVTPDELVGMEPSETSSGYTFEVI